MKKYKLINRKSNEEHICEKITVDGFDYYVSDESIKPWDFVGYPSLKHWTPIQYVDGDLTGYEKKIIATTNSNVDVPKVVDEVEIECENLTYKDYKHLCVRGYNKAKETYKFTEEDIKWIFAKTVELSPTAESHTIMISNSEYRNHVLDGLYKNVMKYWEEQKTETIYFE